MSDTQDPVQTGEADPAPAGETTSQSRDSGQDALSAQLRIAQKQLKDAQAKINRFESAAAESERAKLGEVDRYKAEAADWKAKFETATVRSDSLQKSNAFRFAALAAGIDGKRVDDALKLADLSEVTIEGDQVHGVDAALRSLLKDRQYLLGSKTSTAAASGGGGNPGSGAPSYTPEQVRKIMQDPAQAKEFRAKVLSGEIKL